MTIKIRNDSGVDGTWIGQFIASSESYIIPEIEKQEWAGSGVVLKSVASSDLVVADDGVDLDSVSGWKLLIGTNQFPVSEMDGVKIAVHTSYKPHVPGKSTYAVWTGAGDDVVSDPSVLGGGPLLCFNMVPGTQETILDIKFDHTDFGRVWVHEAYLKFMDGGVRDHISADVVATATQLQTVANLDLILEEDLVKYSPSGPGTGTHGFAATPVLIPRTYSKDGDWDFDGTDLTPNMSGSGGYKISTVETPIHRYVNNIPCQGQCPTYFSMSSDETSEIHPGYFMRVCCHNVSDSTWNASVIMELYRERTVTT